MYQIIHYQKKPTTTSLVKEYNNAHTTFLLQSYQDEARLTLPHNEMQAVNTQNAQIPLAHQSHIVTILLCRKIHAKE